MTTEEKNKLDAAFKELTKHEIAFLKEENIEPNEHGAYAFYNEDRSCGVALDFLLTAYKNYLVEHRIVKEI